MKREYILVLKKIVMDKETCNWSSKTLFDEIVTENNDISVTLDMVCNALRYFRNRGWLDYENNSWELLRKHKMRVLWYAHNREGNVDWNEILYFLCVQLGAVDKSGNHLEHGSRYKWFVKIGVFGVDV